MQKNYDHTTEDNLYANWKESGKMRADNQSKKKSFTIPLPPPNVTGQLHLGHAAMLAIEDIMIRFKRMTDHEVLWIPGTDHAAIATENVVLKHLKAKSREEYSREEFLEHCKDFAAEKHETICHQMEKMGAWLDWSREAYTFDNERNFSVNRIFKMLYEDGLIVRGHRMINWSIGAQSVISDDELEYEDIKEPFYYIKCGEFVVGTVRPETKCANSPVVVHPDSEYVKIQISTTDKEKFIISKYLLDDEDQFKKVFNLVGEDLKFKVLETFKGKDIEGQEFEYETYAGKRKFHVIADSVIDPHKGSGAMTISCNHSADDYDLGKRLDLDEFFFDKIDMEGKMTDISGPCKGMSITEARKASGKLMENMKLLVGKDSTYQHRVPLCYRSGCVVEPMISPQWFISVEKEFEDKFSGEKTTLKKQMQEAVRGGHVKIIPQKFEKEYFRWIDNLRDWCISRQIWWGHRIPVWYDENQKIHLPTERKLVFARHGQSQANAGNIFQGSGSDTSLTEKGQKQARKLADNLLSSGEKFTKVICSDLKRASETGQIIADKLGIKNIETWSELREMSFGDLDGKTKQEVFGKEITTVSDELPFIFDDNIGDNFEAIIKKRQKVLEKLKNEDGNILIISHETTLATIFATHKLGERLCRDTFQLFSKNFEMKNSETQEILDFIAPKTETKHNEIIWARHGQTDAGKNKIIKEPNDPINESGIMHAEVLATSLKKRNITKIISSNSKRALQTAEIVAKRLNLKVEIWHEFNAVDFGKIEGTAQDPNKMTLERAIEEGTGESTDSIFARTEKGLAKLKKVNTPSNILVITHRSIYSAVEALEENTKTLDLLLSKRRKKTDAHFGILGESTFQYKNTKSSALKQDEDTLDTWFSSALWPFSTVGWDGEENKNPDFQKFYPNSVLETGWDILFFWVARMIMFGKYATGKYPFHTVYLHGMVTDEHGKKMSKSKGNGIDPLDMIKDFGADPVRLSLVIGSTPGQKIPIGENKIKGYRNFVNKLWNAGRFVEMQLEQNSTKYISSSIKDLEINSLAEKWILSQFSKTAKAVKKDLENYQISSAGDKVYHFVWGEFCDWYIEASKVSPNPDFLASLYGEILKLVHPLCPFVTEQIWKDLFGQKDKLLLEQSFPALDFQDKNAVAEFEKIQTIVNEIRSLRADNKLNPKEKLKVSGKISDKQSQKLIENLAGVEFADFQDTNTQKIIVENIEIVVAIPVDEARQQKELDNLKKEISALEGRLSNKKYVDNAPEKLVNETKDSLKKAKEKLKKLE